MIDWRMKGEWMKACNCAFGCPCDFNALPTYGRCHGMGAMRIQEGHFGDTDLAGVCWANMAQFPAALHLGNGTLQFVIDERANAAQRRALETILLGREQVEGTMFVILNTMSSTVLPTRFAPIAYAIDHAARRARLDIPGILRLELEPIRNPVTGTEHRIALRMPHGFEFEDSEVLCAARLEASGDIKYAESGCHGGIALVEHTTNGFRH